MIQRLAIIVTNRWVKTGIVSPDRSEIYAYGLDIVMSTAWITLLVVTSSLIYGDIFFAVLYYACFYPLRGYCGGYHAKTHWGCALLQCVSFTMAVVLAAIISDHLSYMMIMAIYSLMLIAVGFLAPVEHPVNPIGDGKRRKLRMSGIITLLLAALATMILKYLGLIMFSNMLVTSATISIISMLFAMSNIDSRNIKEDDDMA